MIAILDYGMANLRSVQKAFEAVGHAAIITSDPNVQADHLVLPGVGAFPDAMAKLIQTGLDRCVLDHISRRKPFLGICLGLQLLFKCSHEGGLHDGLGVFDGEVVPFVPHPGLKIPHMGWNTLQTDSNCPLFKGLAPEPSVYFVHGYFALPNLAEIVSGWTDYPTPFAAVIWKDNVFATQFHPEKSQDVGLQMLQNFAAI